MAGKLNKYAYEKLIEGDLAWLEELPATLENAHVQAIVRRSVHLEYQDEVATFNHTRADGPYDPCDVCLAAMKPAEILSFVNSLREEISELKADLADIYSHPFRGGVQTASGSRDSTHHQGNLTKKETMTKIKPLHDRLIVRRIEADDTTAGGIIIPENAKDAPAEGDVIAVGNGKLLDDGSVRPMSLKTGDRILFSKYGGQEIVIDGDKHLVMREDDVLGVIEAD